MGTPTAAPQGVTGGLIHRVYRLDTTVGTFAVKVLDPPIMEQPGIRDEFRRSEQIAAAFAAAGIPAVLALECSGGVVQDVESMTVIVYPWCAGRAFPKSAVSPHHAQQIGEILGRIHVLDLRSPGETMQGALPTLKAMPQREWHELVDQGRKQGIEWATAIDAALPDLFSWNEAAREAEQALPPTLVISHCDLDQKNVLWQDANAPVLIDWESEGPTRPSAELIGAALDWSGQNVGPPDQTAFGAVLNGYRQEAEFSSGVALGLLQCRLAGWTDWLKANMHRSLDPSSSAESVALSVQEATQTLTTMYALAAGMTTWATWCG